MDDSDANKRGEVAPVSTPSESEKVAKSINEGWST